MFSKLINIPIVKTPEFFHSESISAIKSDVIKISFCVSYFEYKWIFIALMCARFAELVSVQQILEVLESFFQSSFSVCAHMPVHTCTCSLQWKLLNALLYTTRNIKKQCMISVVQWSEFLATDPEVRARFLRRYQIFWEVAGLELSPISLVSTIEELLGRKSSGSGLENREYGHSGSAALPPRLALTSPTSGRSVGIVRSLIQARELFVLFVWFYTSSVAL
jgi:hypothetical protein